ncbi:MAG: GTP-binding protein [archaeon]|nr:GTP-binding protein [archaeon]
MQKKLNSLLSNVMDCIENIEMIAVVDRDGMMLSSKMKSEADEVIGSVTASFDSFIDRIKREFTGEKFFNSMTLGDKKFFFASAGDNAILTIVGNTNANTNEIKVFGEFAAGKITAIMQGQENISIEIPSIVQVMSKFRDGKIPAGKFSVKIIVVGDYQVGKTSLIRRYVDDSFSDNYISTIGVDITKKTIVLSDECSVNFLIWDIGGQMKQMAPYRKRFYTGANAIFVVFDKTRKSTIENVKLWLDDFPQDLKNSAPKILIGNKNDLIYDFKVTTEETSEYSKNYGMEFIETSAKTGENVEEAFKFIAYKVIK